MKPSLLTQESSEKISKNCEKKSVGPDGVPGGFLKLGREAMTPYLPRNIIKHCYHPKGLENSHSGSYLQKGLSIGTVIL